MINVPNGHKFGMLTVLEEVERAVQRNGKFRRCFKCVCECGVVKNYRLADMNRKHPTHSCGCDKKRIQLQNCYKHGMSTTKFYSIWEGLKNRCDNPNEPAYKYYGGRGITYIERRKDFLLWKEDMYDSYLEHCKTHGEEQTSIDRIDVNGNYTIENCRRATDLVQANNTRTNKYHTYHGEVLTQAQIARKLNVRPMVVCEYVKKYGNVDGIDERVTRPKRSGPNKHKDLQQTLLSI